jgi:hypothetical protein
MSRQSRKKLASLTFTEKVKLLEKLRERSLVFAEARKKLFRDAGEADHSPSPEPAEDGTKQNEGSGSE